MSDVQPPSTFNINKIMNKTMRHDNVPTIHGRQLTVKEIVNSRNQTAMTGHKT